MAGNLGRLDGAAADLLAPGDIGAPEGVRPEARKVATLGSCGLVERVANARVPQRLSGCSLLLEDERIWRGVVLGSFPTITRKQVADAQAPFAIFALWATDVLVPDSLLDFGWSRCRG